MCVCNKQCVITSYCNTPLKLIGLLISQQISIDIKKVYFFFLKKTFFISMLISYIIYRRISLFL